MSRRWKLNSSSHLLNYFFGGRVFEQRREKLPEAAQINQEQNWHQETMMNLWMPTGSSHNGSVITVHLVNGCSGLNTGWISLSLIEKRLDGELFSSSGGFNFYFSVIRLPHSSWLARSRLHYDLKQQLMDDTWITRVSPGGSRRGVRKIKLMRHNLRAQHTSGIMTHSDCIIK